MSEDLSHEVTRRLRDWQGGDRAALEKLTPLVYDELRRLASHYLRGERRDHTLQGTALVHEAFIRLVGQSGLELHSRAHFVGVAARLMFPPKVWMIITIGGVVVATLDVDYAQEMLDTIRLWRSLNWLTIATAAVILTFHLLAILNFNNPRRTKEGIS